MLVGRWLSGGACAAVIAAGAALGFAAPAAAAAPALACELDALRATVGTDVTIESVKALNRPVPFCRVEGYVTTRNPGPNPVGFLVAMPSANWNGRYFFNSVGGSVGFLQEPPPALLAEGFAIATTDTGHKGGGMLDWSALADPAQSLDLRERSMHVSAVTTQAITKAYYGATSMYRYVQGCSGGGSRVLMEARKYPGDYDGYIAEAPGISQKNILSFIWVAQYLATRPDAWVSPAKLALLEARAHKLCGAIDGVVMDSLACKFDPAELKCAGADGPDCLTEAQLGGFRRILSGTLGPKGEEIYPGWTTTNISSWGSFAYGPKPPPWSGTQMGEAPAAFLIAHSFTRALFGPKYNFVTDFDFRRQGDIDRYMKIGNAASLSPLDADFSGAEKAGAKMLYWHGMSDQGISYAALVRYFEKLRADMGPERADRFTRMFAAPGVWHCAGGTGPVDTGARALDAMVNWVEKGVAPVGIVTNRPLAAGGPNREFLLCPFPQKPVYVGPAEDNEWKVDPTVARSPRAPIFSAANWECQGAR